MIDTRYCQLMADDNQWMNTKLYRALRVASGPAMPCGQRWFFRMVSTTKPITGDS